MRAALFSRARSKHHEGIEWSRACGVLAFDIASHFHEEWQIMTVEEGARGVRFGAQKDNVVATELLLIPPGLTHGSFSSSSSPCNYRSVHLASNLIEEISTELFRKPHYELPKPVRFSDQQAQSVLIRLHRTLASGTGTAECESLLVELFRALGPRIKLNETRCVAGPKRTPALIRAREYIDAHCTYAIRTDQLCAETGLSKYYFVRLFLATFGVTPHAYHLQRRVLLAKKLIAQGYALSTVAASCGFADQSHLTFHFRRCTGVTPGRFRASLL